MRHPCLLVRAVENPPEPRTEGGIVQMNFKDFPRNVLAYEGGWVDHPKEPRWGNNERGYASHFGTPKSKIALHNISDD